MRPETLACLAVCLAFKGNSSIILGMEIYLFTTVPFKKERGEKEGKADILCGLSCPNSPLPTAQSLFTILSIHHACISEHTNQAL